LEAPDAVRAVALALDMIDGIVAPDSFLLGQINVAILLRKASPGNDGNEF